MPDLPTCPSCGSDLVQPLRWQQHEHPSEEMLVELRCPECYVVMQACHTAEELEALDRRQTASRDQIRTAYEQAVTENMESLADALREALARDLVGADDFAPRRRRPPSGPGTLPRAA